MTDKKPKIGLIASRIVFLSILLLFFTIPHTLEDFASGEPGKAGIPAPLISLVVSVMFGLQALGLYWLGQNRRRGLWAQLVVYITQQTYQAQWNTRIVFIFQASVLAILTHN